MSAFPPVPVESKSAPLAVAACRAILRGISALSLLTFLMGMVYMLLGPGPFWAIWEDSFMLVRYADNLIGGHGLIWNPGGPPTYGLTSVFYVIPVAVIQAIVPNKPILSLALTSFLCGCLFLVLMAGLLWPLVRNHRAAATAAGILILVSFARASYGLSIHFWSGMDTMFDLAMVAVYLLIATWQSRKESWTATVVMGIAGGSMYGVRPDLMLYTLLIPAVIAVFSKSRSQRVKGAVALGITVATLGVLMLGLYIYFGSALPLSFYAKGLKHYGDFEYEKYQRVPYEQLGDYLGCYCLLVAVIGFDALSYLEHRGRDSHSPLYIALLCGTVLYILYFLFFVLQIMPFFSRFYYPTLPAILWLAVVSTRRLVARYGEWFLTVFRSGSGWGWAAGLFGCGLAMIVYSFANNATHVIRNGREGFHNWSLAEEYAIYYGTYWFRLDRFSALPADLKIACTEIGHVAAMNPGKTIIDMAGLNDIDFAKHPFSAKVLFAKFAPDLVFMPHPGYRAMVRETLADPTFKGDYDYFPPSELGPRFIMGIAIRRDSKYYKQMREITTAAR